MHLPIWAAVLLFQNFAFTFVSRARNSGSLLRHVIAAIFSNLIFIIQFSFVTSARAEAALHGQLGLPSQIGIALFYTFFTVLGSVAAHYFSLATERGKGAVGANKKLTQFSAEEGEEIRRVVRCVKTEVLTLNSFGKDGAMILALIVDAWRKQQEKFKELEDSLKSQPGPQVLTDDQLRRSGTVPPIPTQGMKV